MRVLHEGALKRLRQQQRDNMPYRADIYDPPSTEADESGQPPEPQLTGSAVPCRSAPVDRKTIETLFAGQPGTQPTEKVVFPYGTPISENGTIVLTDDRETRTLSIVSKTPHHPNATAEIVYCRHADDISPEA